MDTNAHANDSPKRDRQTLLIDADDTLWENNIYFERVIASFISFLDHQSHSADEVREHLNRIELQTIAEHGYGTASFCRSLVRCFEELSQATALPHQHERLVSFARSIADQEIELLPHVGATVTRLATRNQLILVTKGNQAEQLGKLERSGLAGHFSAVEVPAEKHPDAYRDILARHDLQPASTWMIGNSPRSDINPALAAGLNAVFLPHHFTWILEHEAVAVAPAGQHLLLLNGFADLLEHF